MLITVHIRGLREKEYDVNKGAKSRRSLRFE